MIIFFEDITDWRLHEVGSQLNKIRRKVKSLHLEDLTFHGTGNGAYAFWNGNSCEYVGKTSSRSFIERIPAHFDHRINAWFASYPRAIINKIGDQLGIQTCEDAVRRGLKASLAFIVFQREDNNKRYCQNLEKVIKFTLEPHLNPLGKIPTSILKRNDANNAKLIDAIKFLS